MKIRNIEIKRDQKNHDKIPLNPPFPKGETPISSLWPPARRASGPEGKGRSGGILQGNFKQLK
jgi:hypothetical protein